MTNIDHGLGSLVHVYNTYSIGICTRFKSVVHVLYLLGNCLTHLDMWYIKLELNITALQRYQLWNNLLNIKVIIMWQK